jgi:hypothetical protein
VNPNTQTREFSLLSRSGIRTDITLRSVRSLRPDKALIFSGLLPVDGLHGSWLEQTTGEIEPVSDILSVCI